MELQLGNLIYKKIIRWIIFKSLWPLRDSTGGSGALLGMTLAKILMRYYSILYFHLGFSEYR